MDAETSEMSTICQPRTAELPSLPSFLYQSYGINSQVTSLGGFETKMLLSMMLYILKVANILVQAQ
jgi:hypothetical protein